MKSIIGIIGAGPAGLFAAIHAAKAGAAVLLWDSNPSPGRKLAVTGNGRGNLSNSHVRAEQYGCDSPSALQKILTRHDHAWLRRTLFDLGVLTFCTEDGWCYPQSLSAAAVAEILTVAAKKYGAVIYSECKIKDVQRKDREFIITATGNRTYQIQRLVLACGGKAHPQLGADDSGLRLAEKLGIQTQAMRPALAPLRADVKALHKLQGVRLDVHASLYDGKQRLGSTCGNLIFTQYGLNGPAAMNVSCLVNSENKQKLQIALNFLPNCLADFKSLFEEKTKQGWPLFSMLTCALPPKLATFLMTQLGLRADRDISDLSESEIRELYDLLTHFRISVQGVQDFSHAQLAAGGVPLSAVDPLSMASRQAPAVYLAGEILDVTGPCGGYNLHFAFATGACAGISAAG